MPVLATIGGNALKKTACVCDTAVEIIFYIFVSFYDEQV